MEGKLALTQAKSTWILPTYFNEAQYVKVRDRLFISKKTQKSAGRNNRDITSKYQGGRKILLEHGDHTFASNAIPSNGEMPEVYSKLKACKIKAVALRGN